MCNEDEFKGLKQTFFITYETKTILKKILKRRN